MKKGRISIFTTLLGVTVGAAIGAGLTIKKKETSDNGFKKLSDKHLALFLLMNQWVKIKQENKNVSSYLEKHGYMKIAIYGMSYAGETLVKELKDSNVTIVYGIDKNAEGMYADVDILSLDDHLPDVDAIIVTAITFYDEIEKQLSAKVNCPIISLEDVLYDI